MSRRQIQVAELIKRELSGILERHLDRSPSTLVTINEVVISPDFLEAKVYVSIFPEEESKRVFKEMELKKNDFYSLLFKKLKMKIVPKIQFHLDWRPKEADKVEKIIKKLQNESK